MATVKVAVVFIGQQGGDLFAQRGDVSNGDQTIRLAQTSADIFKVKRMRPHQHRNSMRSGLQRVMPAAFYQ